MNTFHFFLFVFVSFLSSVFTNVVAQQKIAFIDAEEVVQNMPEYKKVKTELETFQKQLVKQLDQEKKNIAAFYKEVMEKVKLGALSPKQQQDADVELQKKQQHLKRMTDDVDRNLLRKEQELTEPVYQKFDSALKKVAEENQYNYIFDKKMLLSFDSGIDVTEKVRKHL
jgi:outer membrane protein